MSSAADQALSAARQARAAGRAIVADEEYVRAAELARSAGDDALCAHALRHVSDLARERGDLARALAAGEEAVALPLWREARALYDLAAVPEGVAECDARLLGAP